MSMYSVRVESDFAAAHFLKNYNGKCENIHGHNYRVCLWAKGKMLNEGGMLVDFALLKSILKKVCKVLDHTNLNENWFFDGNPSAERIAAYIFDEAAKELPPEIKDFLQAVEVYETPGNMARYEP